MPRNSKYEELADRCAQEFKVAMLNALPRIDNALDAGAASFSTTVQFPKRAKDDDSLTVLVKPRERVPVEPIEIKVSRQLGLFDGAEA